MRRHAGTRIKFQEYKVAGVFHHDVDPSPTAGAEHSKSRFAGRLDFPSFLLRQLRRAIVLHGVAEILIPVVVVPFRRLDFNNGLRLSVQNRHRKFSAKHTFFDEHPTIQLQGRFQRFSDIGFRRVL